MFNKQLKEWIKTDGVFQKPKLHIKFGLWKHDGNLPVWRGGPVIRLGKPHKMYMPKNFTYVKAGQVDTEYGKVDKYESSYHKLPVKPYTYVWQSYIRKKLHKYHLGWIPPEIHLPEFLAFHIFNYSMMWKTKYEDYRYEYPPQFTIVLFGVALSLTWHAPTNENFTYDDDYWESLLTYLYACDRDIKKTFNEMGYWTSHCEGDEGKRYRMRKEFLSPEYWNTYDEAFNELKEKNPDVI